MDTKARTTYASGNPWVSRALGVIDTLLALAVAKPAQPQPIAAPRRILVANTGHLGDVILATAVLPVLRAAFPQAHIGFLIGSWGRPVLLNHPLVDELHVFDPWKLQRGDESWWRKLRRHQTTRRQALTAIAHRHYDVAIDLRPYFGNAIPLLWQAGVPCRVGYPSGGFGPLLTHPVPWHIRPWHVVDYHRALLQVLPVHEEHLARLQPTLAFSETAGATSAGPDLILHMGSGAACKEWPLTHWLAVCRRLATAGHTIGLTGRGPLEAERCAQLAADVPGAVNLCDRLPWHDLLSVIRRARVLVAVDSMAGHLAAALGTPCVVVSNGINHAEHWRPRSNACRVMQHAVPCAPCFRAHGCATMDCVRKIEVDQVHDAIQEMLQRETAKRILHTPVCRIA